MKKIISLIIFSLSLNSFFSQDSDLVQCIKKNISLEKINDTLNKQILLHKKDQNELFSKFEDQKKSLDDLKNENKELKSELADIKKVSYSKAEFNNEIAKKELEIEAIKKEYKQKEEKLQLEKRKLEENNRSTLSILSEMNGTFFEKKVRDNYTLDYIKNHPFKREDSLFLKKYDAMIVSLNADPSMTELKSSKILDKAANYNNYYFKLLEVYSTLDFAFDSTKVVKAISTLSNINIPSEYEGLILSKAEIIKILTDYCKIQAELFKNLKVMDKIQDKNQRFSKIEPVSKLEKFKHYKYLRDTIIKYASEKFELPETICTSK